MRFFSIAKIASIMAVAGAILSACVVVEEGPGMRPPPHQGRPPIEGPIMRPPPQSGPVCTREYAPVCGERRGQRQTFGNDCIARAEGFRVIHGGECRREGGNQQRPVACTQEYRPVCAERRGEGRTFANSCTAEAEGYRVVSAGECRPSRGPRDGRPRW